MSITDIIQYLIIGIITGSFSTFAPVLVAHGIDAIMSIFRNA